MTADKQSARAGDGISPTGYGVPCAVRDGRCQSGGACQELGACDPRVTTPSPLYQAFCDLAKARDERNAAVAASARLMELQCMECEDPECAGDCGTDEGMHQHHNGGW